MLRPLLLGLAAASLTLAGCQTTGRTSGPSGAPDRPEPLCPADLLAPSRPEPLPPSGVKVGPLLDGLDAALGEEAAREFWRWMTVDYPAWAREGWRRVDAARARCPP